MTLDDIRVEVTRQRDTRAVVSHASNLPYVLLGMTFFQQVDISENVELMVLTSKL